MSISEPDGWTDAPDRFTAIAYYRDRNNWASKPRKPSDEKLIQIHGRVDMIGQHGATANGNRPTP